MESEPTGFDWLMLAVSAMGSVATLAAVLVAIVLGFHQQVGVLRLRQHPHRVTRLTKKRMARIVRDRGGRLQQCNW